MSGPLVAGRAGVGPRVFGQAHPRRLGVVDDIATAIRQVPDVSERGK